MSFIQHPPPTPSPNPTPWPGAFMASRLLHRLKRSFFKDGHEAELQQEEAETREEEDCDREAELEEEEECVTDRLGGTLCFDSREGGTDDGGEGDRSGLDSDSDFLGESMEEGLSSTGECRRPAFAASFNSAEHLLRKSFEKCSHSSFTIHRRPLLCL